MEEDISRDHSLTPDFGHFILGTRRAAVGAHAFGFTPFPSHNAGCHSTQSIPDLRPLGRKGRRVCLPLQAGSNRRSTPLEDVSMKQSCVSAFARAARSFALAAVVLGIGAGSLLAQGSTGKIEGRVLTKRRTHANRGGHRGTAFNALTNPRGTTSSHVPSAPTAPSRLHRLQVDSVTA